MEPYAIKGSTSGLLTLNGNTGSVIKWQWAVSPFTSWTDIANTTTTYTSGTLTATTKFRTVVQSGVCSTLTSGAITVIVNQTLTAIVTPAGPVNLTKRQSQLLIATTGAGYTYTWMKDNIPIVPAATNSTYLADSAGFYSVIINKGTCSAISNGVTVNIVAPGVCNLNVPTGLHTTAIGNYNVSLAWTHVNANQDSSFVVRIYPAEEPRISGTKSSIMILLIYL